MPSTASSAACSSFPGHGNVVGLGQALSQEAKHLEIYQGMNEQAWARRRGLRQADEA